MAGTKHAGIDPTIEYDVFKCFDDMYMPGGDHRQYLAQFFLGKELGQWRVRSINRSLVCVYCYGDDLLTMGYSFEWVAKITVLMRREKSLDFVAVTRCRYVYKRL